MIDLTTVCLDDLLAAIRNHPEVRGFTPLRSAGVLVRKQVAAIWGFSVLDLIGDARGRRLSGARYAGMAVLYEMGFTLAEAASCFGRTHKMAALAISQVRDRRGSDLEFTRCFEWLRASVGLDPAL